MSLVADLTWPEAAESGTRRPAADPPTSTAPPAPSTDTDVATGMAANVAATRSDVVVALLGAAVVTHEQWLADENSALTPLFDATLTDLATTLGGENEA